MVFGWFQLCHGLWQVILSPKQGGGITVAPKTSDLVVVSPQAGNCFEMAEPRLQELL